MVVVATGISGTGEKEYSKALSELIEKNRKHLTVFNVGEMIDEEARRLGIRLKIENVLNIHKDTIRALRNNVFKSIFSDTAVKRKKEAVLINVHGAFYWKSQYMQSIDYYDLSQLNPDFYINFINNSDIVLQNLKLRRQWKFLFENRSDDYALERIMEWQTVEHLSTTIMANFSGKPLFIVPARGKTVVLMRLMFEKWRKIFYLGMPLTFFHGDAHKKSHERIEDFAKWLERYVILIDPRHVEPLKANQLTSNTENKSIHHHIVGRDLNLLLPQCDGMIGFYPEAVTSYGENCERAEAHRTNGDTFLIYPKKDFLSPFFTEWSENIFENEEEFKPKFLEYLGTEYLEKVENVEKCYSGDQNG